MTSWNSSNYLDQSENDPIIYVRKSRRRAPRLIVESDSEDEEPQKDSHKPNNNNNNNVFAAPDNQYQPHATSFNDMSGSYLYPRSGSVSPAPSLLSPGSLSSRQDSVCSLNGMINNNNSNTSGFDFSSISSSFESRATSNPIMMGKSIRAAPPSPVLSPDSGGPMHDNKIPCNLLGQAARLAEMAILADDIMDLDMK